MATVPPNRQSPNGYAVFHADAAETAAANLALIHADSR